MHPAFSVIFFTTLSGAGYGLWVWLGLRLALGGVSRADAGPWLAALMLGGVLVSAGLLASLGHLGKPGRAWRALSQWRSSWLSREGVAALATFVPAGVLLLLLGARQLDPAGHGLAHVPGGWLSLTAALLIVGSLATVASTAMIYASLKPIPAWRQALVLPGYLGFALLTGSLLDQTVLAWSGRPAAGGWAALAMAVAMAWLKLAYWRAIDTTPLPVSRGDALGLPARAPSVFERPHTEANYVTREMGFVLARKHGHRLRVLAVALFGAVPVLCLLLAQSAPAATAVGLALATLSALLGVAVERWLFFAQARHVVSLYY
ncbi:dimethyl sulfoxide reductase anchor subunit family protein [Aerolutibacter ruishenii]|uniref:DMSO reductase anchor subunit n=1 Tax=Aerolutibacter ruishenii TaxID=686800 RepID=A0A562M3B9_9GAMM|nr:DmsC/YnfH family molybdoenzyme membrane anchor subunit [Lysobacter ruishenii]TWI14429.1 DMSO reductase anchor subunit [Lysobacter ruishenii]